MILSKIEKNRITPRKDVVIWALLFENVSKIKVTLANYFSSWAKTMKSIELIQNAAQWGAFIGLYKTNV